ncbi:MAG TPA: radical SAM protein [Candidatus Sulfotelmatobacter sp.]|nr:radical SAM protein [Candidatus Sulfotelmatobacter sp.]
MAKTRPYLFYDVAISICSTCFQRVDAKTVFQDGNVYLLKRCPQHGAERVLIADDIDYYRRSREVFIKPPEMPLVYNTPVKWGCPYDCGLCTDHEQHSCLTLVEICDYCNLRCPVCYAASGPERQQFRTLPQIEKMLDAVVRNEGHPDVVQLSGGEPTMHPDFFTIVEMAKARPIKHLMVNTNGVRIAQEEDFVKRLADIKDDFEVYLQFDSFEREPLMQLRGADLRRIREDALEKLNRYNISTNLVVTLKKGLNDHEIGKTIDYALQQPCVRGVTFQPIQDAGRLETWIPEDSIEEGAPGLADFARPGDFDFPVDTDSLDPQTTKPGKYVRNFNPATDRLTLTEVRRKILEQTKVFRPEDIIPVPCHPDSLAMAYALKLNGKVTPLTSMIPPEVLINGAANTILYEQDDAVRANLFKLFATNHSPSSGAGTLRELLCCLPKVWIPDAEATTTHVETAASAVPPARSAAESSRPISAEIPAPQPLAYENIFRIIIMQFIDAHSFDVRSIKKTCVHIVHPDGRLIPFDTYNLFYRDDLERTRLAPLRAKAESALAPV